MFRHRALHCHIDLALDHLITSGSVVRPSRERWID